MSASASSSSTGVDAIPRVVSNLRKYFNLHGTKKIAWRREQLRACLRLMEENEPAIRAALLADVGKPWFEATFTEIVKVQTSIRSMLEKLDEWVAPVPCPTPAVLLPGSSYVIREPYGVILIIAPFNYPFQLTILPLIACIAAGNCALIKPSEEAPASSKLIAELIPRYLDVQAFQVIEGGIPETTALLAQQWDKIFFTGSERVGRIVAQAAAKTLTPCTLELGGKSPVILGTDADIPLAARRTMWGKCLNSGQSCIAPDYLFVPTQLKSAFAAECAKVVQQFYEGAPQKSEHYGRIVNERHTARLGKLIEASKSEILSGGSYDVAGKYVEPTVLDSTLSSPCMQEEIFGPLLPLIAYDDIEEVLSYINSQPKALSLYIFSSTQPLIDSILERTSSGGVSINDVMMHSANSAMPFGGQTIQQRVGISGMGAYHGKHGFESLSHARAVLHKSKRVDGPARYPPYTEKHAKLSRRAYEMNFDSGSLKRAAIAIAMPVLAGVLIALLYKAGFRISKVDSQW